VLLILLINPKPSSGRAVGFVRRCPVCDKKLVIAAVWRHYSRSFAAKCHQAGAIVIVDESGPTCWEDAIAWNSDGIQSDHPAQLITFMELRKR
jgi:hypothetical protein